eukprot:jgi/Orpsp1_1/1185561/evm.model.c7180000094371.1
MDHINFNIIFYIYILFTYILNNSYSHSIYVSNEDEFKNALNLNLNYTDVDIILTSSITLKNNYVLFSKGYNLQISGITRSITLTFENENHELQLNNFSFVEISNLTFVGNLHLISCDESYISYITFNGLFKNENLYDYYDNQFLSFENVEYYNLQNKVSPYGITLSCGINYINNSTLYGSKSISDYLINIISKHDEIYSTILYSDDSYFSGEYTCGIIKCDKSYLNVYGSSFVNGFILNN